MDETNSKSTDISIVDMEKIILGERIRTVQDDTRLKNLKASIEKEGLLQPIIINQDNKLIAGYRRYTCCRELGHTNIQAKRVYTKDDLHEKLIEIKENVDRKAFTFSEKMQAAKTIEPIIKEFAEKRIKEKKDSDLSRFGIITKRGKTRDIMAEILGIGSGKTYDKAKFIWESGDQDIISLLDDNKHTISRAYNRIRNKNKPAEAKTDKDGVIPSIEDLLLDMGTRIDNSNFDYNKLKQIRNLLLLIQEKIEEQLEKNSIEYKIKHKWKQET